MVGHRGSIATLQGMGTPQNHELPSPTVPRSPRWVWLPLVGLLAMPGACATTPTTAVSDVVVTASQAGRTVQLAPGERMMVELLGNPSTGRVWELRSIPDAAVIVPDGTRWVAAKGAGSSDLVKTQQLRFVAQGPGKALLVFEYVEPSAPSPTASSFTVAVEVIAR